MRLSVHGRAGQASWRIEDAPRATSDPAKAHARAHAYASGRRKGAEWHPAQDAVVGLLRLRLLARLLVRVLVLREVLARAARCAGR